MTESSEVRRSLAQRIAPVYATNPKVAAVLLAGSAARGDSDRFSDFEIGVFWHEPPTEADRRQAIERAGGDLHHLYPLDPVEAMWTDDWKIGRNSQNEPYSGVSVDMQNLTVESAQQTIDAVVRAFDPDPNKQTLIAALRTGLALHGQEIIARWRAQTDEYPAELARAVIHRCAQIDHFWRIQMWRERGDPTGVHGKIVAIHGAILHMLLAINHVYYFGVKHRDTLIAQLRLAPADLAQRLDSCFDPAAGEETLRRLVEDVYDLIQRHVPGIDVERLRRIFRYRRPLWDAMPPAGL